MCENKQFVLKTLDADLQDVAELAKTVFERLYNSTLQGALVEKALGENIHDHYKKFRETNVSQACPFCGLENYPDRLKKSRSQYDHYLKISKYMFCAVNFRNLVPMCSVCNEAPNKHRKDVLFSDVACKVRRQAYYPFSNCGGINLMLKNITPSEIDDGGQWNVTVAYADDEEQEKVQTWKTIFNIESRYEARVSEESNSWIVEYIYLANIPDENADIATWRTSFKTWAESLLKINKHKVVRDGVLKQSYFEYLCRDATDSEISGIRSMAQSDMFAARQMAVIL